MRVTSSVAKKHKKKYFHLAKGYYSDKKNRWRQVKQQVEKSLQHAYRDRKDRKGDFRQLWILRINALSRQYGLPYSKFINGLRKAGIDINRKILAELAVHDAESFHSLTEVAKQALE